MSAYQVRAFAWDEGWELYVEGVGVTQVRTLDHARRQVLDFIETEYERDVEDFDMDLHVELGGLEEEVYAARGAVAEAEAARSMAAARIRDVAKRLRVDARLSVTDTAVVLGVSRGRVSQLTS